MRRAAPTITAANLITAINEVADFRRDRRPGREQKSWRTSDVAGQDPDGDFEGSRTPPRASMPGATESD